ncbi:MAG: DUF2634 domain-containing protein [Defluviitaleaceae bacterium]|nr:DUF2634 domain-containing protein [Defluviitaleaceae bacterium]
MIPDNGIDLTGGVSVVSFPTRTYKLRLDTDRIAGYTEGLDAMEQMIYKALLTDRYRYLIYDWNYGFEVDDLFGKDRSYVKPELIRRITECLMADDRVLGVENFAFPAPDDNAYNSARNTVVVTFTARTVFGDVYYSKAVSV